MKNKVEPNSDYSAYLLENDVASAIVTESVPKTTYSKTETHQTGKMAFWGEMNSFPQDVIRDVRKDPEIGTLLDKEARLLYTGGLVYGKIDYKDNGEEILVPVEKKEQRKEINDWLRKSNINRYVLEAARDLYWFYNVFPEVVLSRDKSKIVQLAVQAAENCRFELQNEQGIIENCYINSNFPEEDETTSNTKKLPVLDPYYDAVGALKKLNVTNVIYPLSYPTPGSKYYQLADWDSIRSSGWLSVSAAIPKFKKSFLEKQLNIKYHVEISQLYWEKKYPGWRDKLSDAQKEKIKKEELTTFNNILTGVEKAGNSIVTAMHTDAVGKEYSLWKINVIDDKYKQGQFLEDGKEASLYKMSAIGLHPALVGTMPNNGMGGAGSNIREAYNLHMLMVKSHQDIILEPLSLVRDFNGWDPEIEFRFRTSFMNTLDKGKETTKTVA